MFASKLLNDCQSTDKLLHTRCYTTVAADHCASGLIGHITCGNSNCNSNKQAEAGQLLSLLRWAKAWVRDSKFPASDSNIEVDERFRGFSAGALRLEKTVLPTGESAVPYLVPEVNCLLKGAVM